MVLQVMWHTGRGQESFSLVQHRLQWADKAIDTEQDDVVQINMQQSNRSKGILGADLCLAKLLHWESSSRWTKQYGKLNFTFEYFF